MLFLLLSRQWEVEDAWLAFGLGGLCLCAGICLRIWAQSHLRYRLSVRKTLTTGGPYAYVRNPMYIGNAIIVIGACLSSELFWSAPIMLVWCAVVYHLVVQYEEPSLSARYGDTYRQYAAQVRRWIPSVRPLSAIARTPSARPFVFPSILAEMHNLLLLGPFVLKDWLR
jgi:protein-S-isoprenylcysteine O-methyltransferase Ste14